MSVVLVSSRLAPFISLRTKTYIRVFFAQFIWYCAKWMEWKANNLYFYVVCGNIFVILQYIIDTTKTKRDNETIIIKTIHFGIAIGS